MTPGEYVSVFLIGLLGGGHCLGMCAPFALAVGAGAKSKWEVVWRQSAYHLGKATSYVFLGLLVFLAGGWAQTKADGWQNALASVAGVLMIVAGIFYATEWRPSSKWAAWMQHNPACRMMSVLWHSPSLFKSLLVGWINGFLPCGLTVSALVFVASRAGHTAEVVAGCYLFGAGTFPALLLAALWGRQISLSTRRVLLRGAGVLLILFGVLTMVRGVPQVHHFFHKWLMPPMQQSGPPAYPETCDPAA